MLIACDSVTGIGSVFTAYIRVSNVAQETIVKVLPQVFLSITRVVPYRSLIHLVLADPT
jgi:hypothetical protein